MADDPFSDPFAGESPTRRPGFSSVMHQRSMKYRELGLDPRARRQHVQTQPSPRRTSPELKHRAGEASNLGHHQHHQQKYPRHHQNPHQYPYAQPQQQEHHHQQDSPTSPSSPSSPLNDSMPLSPTVPQLPALLFPPISPRWDSLSNTNHPDSAINLSGRPPLSAFPGLSSHPVSPEFLPRHPQQQQQQQREPPSPPSIHEYSAPETSGYGANSRRPIGPPTSSKSSSIVDAYPAAAPDGGMPVENFSRPRKPSIRRPNKEPPQMRQRTITIPQPDPTTGFDQSSSRNVSPNPSIQQAGWPRGRGFSASSTRSTNTFASLPLRPSNDHLIGAYRTGSLRHPASSTNLARPPVSFNNGNTSAIHTRDPPPWVTTGNDELRSSFRSQLTSSTAQGTLFTPTGTERSSVLTKTSSIAESSILNEYAPAGPAVDEGLSVDDVMGMYEQGFGDDSDRDEDDSIHDRRKLMAGDDDTLDVDVGVAYDDDTREIDGGVGYNDSRPPTGKSDSSGVEARMLEAMSDALPIPSRLETSNSNWEGFRARDPPRAFRSPTFPSSLPQDVGFGLATERFGRGAHADTNTATSATRDLDLPIMLDGHDQQQRQPTSQPDTEPSAVPASHTQPSSPMTNTSAQLPSPRSSPASSPPPPQFPEEPIEDPSCRDRYGFRKENAYITREQYDKWDESYSDYLSRRRKKWVAYLKDSSLMTENPNRFPPRNAKTKRFIRKGLPPDWRGAAWFYYAGGPAILAKHSGLYDELVMRAGLQPKGKGGGKPEMSELKQLVVDDIEKDLHRTFPDNTQFKPPRYANPPPPQQSPVPTFNSGATLTNPSPDQASPEEASSDPEIISSLRRVLSAFALYNPRIGYCQSLNFLAGLLLLFVHTEEQAFWLLNVITRVYLPGTHEMSLEGSKVDLGVFMAALKDALPNVWKQIAGDEVEGLGSKPARKPRMKRSKEAASAMSSPDGGYSASGDPNRLPAITLCMTAWFMSCFIGTLPIETVLRVWDVFFYEGSRTLFRVALTIFKVGEAEIRSVPDPMEMFGVVQALPRRLLDANALMETCYRRRNGIGHLSQETVEERREERRAGMRKWKADHQEGTGGHGIPGRGDPAVAAAAGLDLAASFVDLEGLEVRRKGTLFGRRKDRERARAAEVM